jgi:cytochrome c biogenesis factor
MVLGALGLLIAAATRSWPVGAVAGLLLGLRAGSWWAFMRLGEWERRQRTVRARNWLRRGG